MTISDIAYFEALLLALPTSEQTDLLRACLQTGDNAREAWARWLSSVKDPVAFLKRDRVGVKGMLPLLYTSLRGNDVGVEKELRTILRTAYVNEEVRSASVEKVSARLLDALRDRDVDPTAIGGIDLGYTVYDSPVLRHADRLELVIDPTEIQPALESADSMGCTVPGVQSVSGLDVVDCTHVSGLAVRFRLRLPILDERRSDPTFLWSKRRISLAGVPTNVLAPEDHVVLICSLVFDLTVRQSLRWVCDVWHLLARTPDFKWDRLTTTAAFRPYALRLALTLGYMMDRHDAPVPQDVLSTLAASARDVSSSEMNVLLAAARRAKGGGFRAMLRSAGGWRERLFLMRWLVEESLHRRSGGVYGAS